MASPSAVRVLLVFGVAAGLIQSGLAAQAKIELYRKNKNLDKNPGRSSRNVLCECPSYPLGRLRSSAGRHWPGSVMKYLLNRM